MLFTLGTRICSNLKINHTIALVFILSLIFSTSTATEAPGEKPRIAYMPILDHLTLPIAYELSKKGKFEHFNLQPIKYTSWAELSDAVKTGKVDGAFMLVPLGMHLRQKGTPLQLVLLGHGNDSALVVRPDTKSPEQLKGGILAVPHLFSIHHIILYKYLTEEGRLSNEDFTILEMEPSARGEIDGFLVAQPFPTMAETTNAGRILAYSYEILKDHVSSPLFLLEPVLSVNHKRVDELVKALVKAGKFIESNPLKASRLAASYIGLDEKIIYKCLTSPPDGIKFNDLVPKVEELEEVQRYLVHMGMIETSLKELIADSYARAAYE